MSGGKGGKSTTKVEIPPELKEAAVRNLDRAEKIGSIGYMPYRGPSVAAQTPRQLDAMRNTNMAARAFGMQGGFTAPQAGMPKAITSGGVRGYTAAPIMDEAIAGIPKGQRDALAAFFINPKTGAKGKGGEVPNPQGGGGGTTTPKPGTGTRRVQDRFGRWVDVPIGTNPYGYNPFGDDH